MGYRDEGEAARQRVQNLESQVTEKDEENRELAAKLARANAEIVRLHGQPVGAPDELFPVSPANTIVFRLSLVLSAIALLLLCVAAYGSETAGMQMSMLAIPLCGISLGAWLSRRKPTPRCIATAIACGLVSFVTLFVFFGTVWRHL